MSKITQRPYPSDTTQRLINSGVVPLLARIYAARGIEDPAQLDTDIKHLLPFALLKNAEMMAGLLADAIASRPMVTCSPVEMTTSSSRGSGCFWISLASAIRRLVSPLMAETTTTT